MTRISNIIKKLRRLEDKWGIQILYCRSIAKDYYTVTVYMNAEEDWDFIVENLADAIVVIEEEMKR